MDRVPREPRREPRPVVVNARVSAEGAAQIDAIAEAEDRSRSDVVRILLKEAIEARARAGNLPPVKPVVRKR